jgi:hypothetical protein
MSNEASKYTKIATVERAREMLKRLHDRNQRKWDDLDRDVAFAIEALIASAERYRFIAHGTQAEQAQPFGYFRYDLRLDAWVQNRAGITGTPFYTTPPSRQPWVGLTGDEVNEFAAGCHLGNSVQGAIRKAEAKLREKNT